MKSKILYTACTALALLTGACNLKEHVYSDIEASNFYKNKNEINTALLRPYTHANAWISALDNNNYWKLAELSADQLAWPQKGRHGFDQGKWIMLHNHQWNLDDDTNRGAWELIFMGIGFCNNFIADMEKITPAAVGITEQDKAKYIAEEKVLRAWHYMRAMDIWGNVPLAVKVGDPVNIATSSRKEIFEFVEKEILENIGQLDNLNNQLVGRVTKAGAYAMLSELYLNAQVWSGTPRWDDCIKASDALINGQAGGLGGGPAALETDIYKAFDKDNSTNKENLFQIAKDWIVGKERFSFEGLFWHFKQDEFTGTDRTGNNGVVVIPSAYDAFASSDLRKQKWLLVGPVYKYGTKTPVTGSEEYLNQPLVFVREIRKNKQGQTGEGSMTDGEENSGARFNKYQPGITSDANYWGNDYVVYRLTEVYYNKAEALMRKAGGSATAEAVQLMNTCRQRRFAAADWAANTYTTATLTMDEMLAERGREFIFEGKRRTDLVRFGKFTTASWWDHKPSSETKNLFPIPQSQMDLNTNLKQNPGY